MAALAAVSERQKAFELLRARLSAKPPALPVEGLIRTAIPELDLLLGGGFPAGIVATLEGKTGCWSLAAGLVARTTRRSLVAILDDGSLYPPTLAQAGASLERVLVVPVRKAVAIARAADILLRSRICRLVLMPAVALRDVVWTRLASLAHRSGVLLIVIATHAGAALQSAAVVRLHCVLERIITHGQRGLWGTIAGFDLCVDVRKHKYLAAGRTACVRVGHEEIFDAALP
ncbi:MAG TPA: hypothetical protein VK755_15485 [Candidatus Acidoferrales bacterium]|jgi:hypothetical protein|nr:hypothetical protein [Candidatus Acidoferrales bacterium]